MRYKAVVEITPKPAVPVSAEDTATVYVLERNGFDVLSVRTGKVVVIEFDAKPEDGALMPDDAATLIELMCGVLIDPATEDYGFRLQLTGPYGWGETPMRYSVDETDVKSVDLKGKFPPFGAYELLRAEWKVKDTTFVLIRYAKDGVEQKLGVRMDLDKQAILDDFEDPACEADHQLKESADKIWTTIIIGMTQAG